MSSGPQPLPPSAGGRRRMGSRPQAGRSYREAKSNSPDDGPRSGSPRPRTGFKPSKPSLGMRAGEDRLADIERLQKQAEMYTKRIEMERRRADETEMKLNVSRRKLEESRSRLKGLNEVQLMRKYERSLKTSEGRLENMLQRVNQKVAQNDRKKKEIESLRRDRLQREEVVRKLQDELADATQRARRGQQEQAAAAAEREQAAQDVEAMQSQLQSELGDFEAAFYQQVGAVASKARPTKLDEVDARQMPSQAAAMLLHMGAEDAHHGELSIDQERELKHKSTKTYWDVARREVELREQAAALKRYEDAFARIQQGTQIRTIDEMVGAFVQAEDQHFALVGMINETQRDIEQLEVDAKKLNAGVDRVYQDEASTREKRTGLFKTLEAEIGAIEKRAGAYDRRHDAALRCLDVLKPGVQSLFYKVGASDETAAESLAATGVTEGNVLQFLGSIEERVAEITQLQQLAGVAPSQTGGGGAMASRGYSPGVSGAAPGGGEVSLLRRLLMGDEDALREVQHGAGSGMGGGQSVGSLHGMLESGGGGVGEGKEDADIGAFSPRVAEVGGTGTGVGGPMEMEPLVRVGVVPSSADAGVEGEDEEDEEAMGLAGGHAVGLRGRPRSIGDGDEALLAESARVVDLGVGFRQLAAASAGEDEEGLAGGLSSRSAASPARSTRSHRSKAGSSQASPRSPRSPATDGFPGRSGTAGLAIADATSRSVTLGDRGTARGRMGASATAPGSSRGVSASVAVLPARTRGGRGGRAGGGRAGGDGTPPVPLDVRELKHQLGLAAPRQVGTPGAGGSVAAMRAAADAAGLPHSPLVQPRSARTGRVTLPSRAEEMARLEEEEARQEKEERTARYQELKQHRKGLLAGVRKAKQNLAPALRDD